MKLSQNMNFKVNSSGSLVIVMVMGNGHRKVGSDKSRRYKKVYPVVIVT